MSKRTKFAVSLAAVALAVGVLAKRAHRIDKDDEDTEEAELENLVSAQGSAAGACGVERWAVKTLSDSNASRVDFSPHDTTIHALALSPGGSPWGVFSGSHTMPPDVRTMTGGYEEATVYRVKAIVKAYKLEGDSDFHIVAADPDYPNETIIVESVDPACPGASSSQYNSVFRNVREQFAAAFPTPPGPQFTDPHESRTLTITGVRFFDHLHNQNGVAQNGVEFHPVLCLSFGSDCDTP